MKKTLLAIGAAAAVSVASLAGITPAQAVTYDNCKEASMHVETPILRGEPAYAPHLDRDGDGVACETWDHGVQVPKKPVPTRTPTASPKPTSTSSPKPTSEPSESESPAPKPSEEHHEGRGVPAKTGDFGA